MANPTWTSKKSGLIPLPQAAGSKSPNPHPTRWPGFPVTGFS